MNILKLTISVIALTVTAILFVTACKSPTEQAAAPTLTVYKSASCGCCGKWVTHMQQAGFPIEVQDRDDLTSIKARYGIQPRSQSCHTAVAAGSGYVFEGHIPADIVRRFIDEKPADAIGLTVPGMPIGSPGMEMNGQQQAYDVLMLMRDGSLKTYAHIAGNT